MVEEEDGGLGLSMADSVVAFEALGRGDAAVAGYLTIHNMVVHAINRCAVGIRMGAWIHRLQVVNLGLLVVLIYFTLVCFACLHLAWW